MIAPSSSHSSRRLGSLGFTLIEVMIVVAIIGVIISIAIPSFQKYQNRARQSEAKLALASVYSLEKSFFTEYQAYAPAFDAIGHFPEGMRYYTTSLCYSGPWTGSIHGFNGTTAQFIIYSNSPIPYVTNWAPGNTCQGGPGGENATWTETCSAIPNNPTYFNAGSTANPWAGSYNDAWHMNHRKELRNCSQVL